MEHDLIPYQPTFRIGCARMLVLAPHADDEVFGCGGAILRHAACGDAVHVIIASDGAFHAEAEQKARHAAMRQAESNQAASIMGYGPPEYWGLPDRGITHGEPLIQRIAAAITAFKPDLVMAPSIFEVHPDHLALGTAALEAVRRHEYPLSLAMYEVGVPMQRPNVLLDISDLQTRKQQAMACFASQLKNQRYDLHIQALNRFRTYTLGPQVTAAEAYFLLRPGEALPAVDAQQRADALQRTLDTILHSRSWRFSAPLRALAHWLRG